jgi:rhodanese-related sulfurtransferase/glyoxylase-like metal-dependent hydrolase (beta-lactamase superfamily II)
MFLKGYFILAVLFSSLSVSANIDDVVDISLSELKEQLIEKPDTILLDIRDPQELKITGTIDHPKAFNISRGWLETRIENYVPDLSTPIVVYCGQNIRSPLAAETLMSMGFTDVKNFDEGIFSWESEGNKMWYYDKAMDSPLYEMPIKIIDDVYSAIGAIQPGSKYNYGHNNNLSYIVGDDGVLVFNAGGSYILAAAFHDEIKKVTDKPVKFVVYENTQGHAILGSTYWKEQGALIIAQENALHVIEQPDLVISQAKRFLGNKFFRSGVVSPDIYYSDVYKVPLKGKNIELRYLGPAHGDDETLLWMPDEKLVITGDFAFNERMLPVLATTNINAWLESWPNLVALNPEYIIPGHGHPTDMPTITAYTKDYLLHLKGSVEYLLDEDGALSDIYSIDSRNFKHFGLFKELNNLNLEKIFKMFEFEY